MNFFLRSIILSCFVAPQLLFSEGEIVPYIHKISSSLSLHSYPNLFPYANLSSEDERIIVDNLKLTIDENDSFILVNYASTWVDNNLACYGNSSDTDPIILHFPTALPCRLFRERNFNPLSLSYYLNGVKEVEITFTITKSEVKPYAELDKINKDRSKNKSENIFLNLFNKYRPIILLSTTVSMIYFFYNFFFR